MWSALVTLLVNRTEKWWGLVMEVGLDPELTKWSVHSGPAIVLTGEGYKEHHWLVVPHQPLRLSPLPFNYHFFLSCRCLLIPFPELKINMAGAVPLSSSVVKPATVPTPGGPLLRLCLTKKVIV